MQISSSAESGTAEELGILNFEFLLRQAAEPSGELCAKAHCELFSFEHEFINEQTVQT